MPSPDEGVLDEKRGPPVLVLDEGIRNSHERLKVERWGKYLLDSDDVNSSVILNLLELK